jgi:hypothetical protein
VPKALANFSAISAEIPFLPLTSSDAEVLEIPIFRANAVTESL